MFFTGKKRTNRKEQIELLSELYRISEEHNLGAGMAIKIHFAICAAIFDYNPKISAAMKPEYWEKCMPAVEFLLTLISEHEDITIGDHISEEQEVLEEKPYKVKYFLNVRHRMLGKGETNCGIGPGSFLVNRKLLNGLIHLHHIK